MARILLLPMPMKLMSATGLLAALFVSSIATAAEDDAPAAPRGWYGEQVIIVSAVGHAAVLAGVLSGKDTGAPIAVVGGATFLLGGPVVHLAHGRVGTAAASFGLNVLVPAALGSAGFGLGCAFNHGCDGQWGLVAGIVGSIAGAAIGTMTATGLDAGLLAYEPAQRKRRSSAKGRLPVPRFVPIVNAAPQQVVAGIGGTF